MPTKVSLDRSDIGLFVDFEATRVVLPRVSGQSRTRSFEQAQVRFLGDTAETTWRGEGVSRVYPITVRYGGQEHEQMSDLLELFDLAHTHVDGRLALRLNTFIAPGLTPFEVVTVSSVSESHVAARVWDVTFNASIVPYTLAV